MKPFDDRFAEKVREVFDHHDEAFDSSAWASFKERLREKRKSRIMALFYITLKAAAVLLILGGLTWLSTMLFFSESPGVAERISSHDEFELMEPSHDLSGLGLSNQMSDGEGSALPSGAMDVAALPSVNAVGDRNAHLNGSETEMDEAEVDGIERGSDDLMADQTVTAAVVADSVSVALIQKAGQTDSISMAGFTTGPSQEQQTNGIPQGLDAHNEVAGGNPGQAAGGRLNWSVTAGSIFTYAEQQLASGLGFSGGVLSEYRVSSLLGFSSGLVLAYQQFEVDGMPLRQQFSKAEYDYLPDQYSARTVGDQSYEFLALDVPVNVQLYFQESQKSQWFVSAGFSSLLYLQQRVSGTETAYIDAEYYDTASNTNRTMSYASEVHVESNYDAFTRFDFARLLNVSVGYEIKQERSMTIIEPFIKYPLGPLSSRNIRMGMGGIRMRLRFGH